MKYLLISLFSILSLLSTQFIWAQAYIEGNVMDISNDSILANAKVSTNTYLLTITDDYGYFKIPYNQSITYINVQMLGYEQKIIQLQNINPNKPLSIKLIPKTEQLKEVMVEGKQLIYNRKINKYDVLDYTFMGDSLFVLQKQMGKNNRSLILLNQNFDSLAVLNTLPKNSKALFKDCLGYVHLLTKDSAYQIVLYQNEILFYKPYAMQHFNEIFKPCLFSLNGSLFFEQALANGYGHQIFFLNDSLKQKQNFIRSIDYKNANEFLQNSEIYRYYSTIPFASTNDSATIARISLSHFNLEYLTRIENKPIQNTIYLYKDTIVYFNYHNAKLQLYSNVKKEPKNIDIVYDRDKSNWTNNILEDPVNKSLYMLKKERAVYKIYHLEVQTGKLTYVSALSIFKGKDLKINNGYLYYLTNASNSAYHIKKLARIALR